MYGTNSSVRPWMSLYHVMYSYVHTYIVMQIFLPLMCFLMYNQLFFRRRNCEHPVHGSAVERSRFGSVDGPALQPISFKIQFHRTKMGWVNCWFWFCIIDDAYFVHCAFYHSLFLLRIHTYIHSTYVCMYYSAFWTVGFFAVSCAVSIGCYFRETAREGPSVSLITDGRLCHCTHVITVFYASIYIFVCYYMYCILGPLTKRTATLEIPANVEGDSGIPPWCRARTNPQIARQLDIKTQMVCVSVILYKCSSVFSLNDKC